MKVTFNGVHIHVELFARDSFDMFGLQPPRPGQNPMRLRMTPDEWSELIRQVAGEMQKFRANISRTKA
jgi:hypothetical protein